MTETVNDVKPITLGKYVRWLRDTCDPAIDVSRLQTRFESVSFKMANSFESSGFWKSLKSSLPEYEAQYLVKTGFPLLATPDPPQIKVKPFDSFLSKTQRRNVFQNPNWPAPPSGGWLCPHNWYSGITDIVRTLVLVKYLDGVEFMVGAITALCGEHDLKCEASYEAREEGYYAAHMIVHWSAEVPGEFWDSDRIAVALEIQISTQVQEVIRALLHKDYERKRLGAEEVEEKWQWQYRDDEFIMNYLGHILHYTEGMIMRVRVGQDASPSVEAGKESI